MDQKQKLVEAMKQFNLYDNSLDEAKNLEKCLAMSKEEKQAHIKKLKMSKSLLSQEDDGPHPNPWWFNNDHPERMHLFEKVLMERVPIEDDSENEKGEKVYKKERCPQYKQL